MACGDIAGFDSDRTYPLELDTLMEEFSDWKYEHRDVIQPPTEPAYRKASALKKISKLGEDSNLPCIQGVQLAARTRYSATTKSHNLTDNEEIDPSILFIN